MKRFRILNIILIALIGLAIWRTVDVWQRTPPQIADHEDTPAVQPADPAAQPARRPALPQLVTTITGKDLFDVTREAPSAASGPAPEQTPQPPPTLKLAGVVFVGPHHEAVFIDISQNNKQIRMREGEEISGYKVAKIETQTVSLVSGSGDEVKLDLLLDTAKAPGKVAGPGGMATPQPRAGRAQPGQVAGAANGPGGFGPPGSAGAMQRNDARDRAQRARERLKRLREEAATNR